MVERRKRAARSSLAAVAAALAVTGLTLAACTSSSTGPSDRTTDRDVSTVSVSSARQAVSARATSSSLIALPSGVQASPPPVPADKALAQYLEQQAEQWQIKNPPIVPIIRRVNPDESLALLEQCLTSSGFPITKQGPLGYKPNVPAAQMSAFNLAGYKCSASYPPETKYLQPAGLTYYEAFYNYEVHDTVPCLTKHGYPQTDPVPTLQTYLSELGTPQEWHAINVIAGVTPPKLYEIQRACPPNPPADQLFPPS